MHTAGLPLPHLRQTPPNRSAMPVRRTAPVAGRVASRYSANSDQMGKSSASVMQTARDAQMSSGRQS